MSERREILVAIEAEGTNLKPLIHQGREKLDIHQEPTVTTLNTHRPESSQPIQRSRVAALRRLSQSVQTVTTSTRSGLMKEKPIIFFVPQKLLPAADEPSLMTPSVHLH